MMPPERRDFLRSRPYAMDRFAFQPSLIGALTNPYYFARCALYKELARWAPTFTGCLLDVGCGRMPYRGLFTSADYVGVDLPSHPTQRHHFADCFYDGRNLPFKDATFDGVLCSQVLEHVQAPETFLREVARVIKPGGQLLLTAPLVWDEHEQPVDFWRYTSFGLRQLCEEAGFQVVEHVKTADDARAPLQLLIGYLIKVLPQRPRVVRLALSIPLTATINLIGFLLHRVLPRNADLYLDNVVLARRK